MLNNYYKQILEDKGLKVRETDNRTYIIKPKGISGNKLPFGLHDFTAGYGDTDCPRIAVFREGAVYKAIQWEWTPGPGPGDFCIDFTDEASLVDFINDYYFNAGNPYFTALAKYQIQNRDSISINDVKAILGKFLQQLESTFSDSEIEIDKRCAYNKVLPENWRITAYQEERKMTETVWGFLNFEVAKLRKKIDEGTEFNFEDINNISSLVYELSLQMRDNK